MRRLCLYLRGEVDLEQALDAAFLASAKAILSSSTLNWPSDRRPVLLIARVMQGKNN